MDATNNRIDQTNKEKRRFRCNDCNIEFDSLSNYNRHMKSTSVHRHGTNLRCVNCSKQFLRTDNYKRHVRTCKNEDVRCEHCGKCYQRRYLKRHIAAINRSKRLVKLRKSTKKNNTQKVTGDPTNQSPVQPKYTGPFKLMENAFGRNLMRFRIDADENNRDPDTFLKETEEEQAALVNSIRNELKMFKIQLTLHVDFFKPTNVDENCQNPFWSLPAIIQPDEDVIEQLRKLYPKVLMSHAEFMRKGSGWVTRRISFLDVHIARYKPLRAGCSVALPRYLKSKKAIVNIKNNDNMCLAWCILASRHPVVKNRQRTENYRKYWNEIDVHGIRFPVELEQIPRLELQNDLCINVYGFDNDIIPLHISKFAFSEHINVLLYRRHYFLIKNLDRFLSDQRGGHRRKWFCHRCLFPLNSKEKRDEHVSNCVNNQNTPVKMPEEDTIQFRNIHKMQRRPVLVYADFESLTTKLEPDETERSKKSTTYQHHVPSGYCLIQIDNCCGEQTIRRPIGYRGKDCVQRFLADSVSIGLEFQEALEKPAPMSMTPQDENDFRTSQECHICKQTIGNQLEKVRDHCHLCGKFRGAAHYDCNLQFRLDRDITIVFHNLRRYDGHMIMQHIGEVCESFDFQLSCIARAMEDYVSFTLTSTKNEPGKVWRIRFIDSLQFLSASLDNLAKTLSKEDMNAMKSVFTGEYLELMTRKGVYPYDYMNSWERFSETKLPPKEAFYSGLNGKGITDDEYEYAAQVCSSCIPHFNPKI